ncbi:MAG: prolipoprotein diacylglyceryl transferase [Clostridia bacterium]|nr:prolipoprotein diacylglyceryl transferase [Clostridia bacterium]
MLIQFFSNHGYYFFLGMGAIAMLVLMLARRGAYSLSIMQSTIYTLLLLITGIAGAKLLFFFECGMESFSGMSFFGAVYLVLLAMPLIGALFKLKPKDSLDACAPCVAAIVGFQRFGCFCAGCCGGIPIGNTAMVWPTQLMEGLGDMLILFFLLFVEKNEKFRGKSYPAFLISYGIMRFAIEFVRDTAKDWLGLSHGQWFSIVGICIALLMLGGDTRWRNQGQENIHYEQA